MISTHDVAPLCSRLLSSVAVFSASFDMDYEERKMRKEGVVDGRKAGQLFDDFRHYDEAIRRTGSVGQRGLMLQAGARRIATEDIRDLLGMRSRLHAGDIDLL